MSCENCKEGDSMASGSSCDALALFSVLRILPEGSGLHAEAVDGSFLKVSRKHPANVEVLAHLPCSTVLNILIEAGVFGVPSNTYTNAPWTVGHKSAFGALWLAERVAAYSSDSGW